MHAHWPHAHLQEAQPLMPVCVAVQGLQAEQRHAPAHGGRQAVGSGQSCDQQGQSQSSLQAGLCWVG